MRPIGFSTGAVARGDFRLALERLRPHRMEAIELSALRLGELAPLVAAVPDLDLSGFQFISIHAPSRFETESEAKVIENLVKLAGYGHRVVVHPDVIYNPTDWAVLGDRLLIENMDKRKPVGRSVTELDPFFSRLPDAQFCFDIGHARQVDPSMTVAHQLLQTFGARLAEVHISEVNTASRHDPISLNAVSAFRRVAEDIPLGVPVILESLIDAGQSDVESEIRRARAALGDEFADNDAVPRLIGIERHPIDVNRSGSMR